MTNKSANHLLRDLYRDVPEDDRRESTGETEEDYRSSRTRKATEEDGLPVDVIGKAGPAKDGGRL